MRGESVSRSANGGGGGRCTFTMFNPRRSGNALFPPFLSEISRSFRHCERVEGIAAAAQGRPRTTHYYVSYRMYTIYLLRILPLHVAHTAGLRTSFLYDYYYQRKGRKKEKRKERERRDSSKKKKKIGVLLKSRKTGYIFNDDT